VTVADPKFGLGVQVRARLMDWHDGYGIWIFGFDQAARQRLIARVDGVDEHGEVAYRWEVLEFGAVVAPTLIFGGQLGKLVPQAIVESVSAEEQNRVRSLLRDDFEYERGRSEKLIDALIHVALDGDDYGEPLVARER
jgi:hypothetical protein